MAEPRYFIWSYEHSAWWRPGFRGYTRQLNEAGIYRRTEAIKICRNAVCGTALRLGMLPEIPVRLTDYEDVVRDIQLPENLKL